MTTNLIKTYNKDSLVWCGQAISLYVEREECTGLCSGKIKVILWLKENLVLLEGYSLRDISLALGFSKNEKEGKKHGATLTVTRAVRCLLDIGVLKSDGEKEYRAVIEQDEKKRRKYTWIARAFLVLVENASRGPVYSVGPKKINVLVWLYDNKDNIPGSTRKINFLTGISKKENVQSNTTSSLFPLLIEAGLIVREKREDGTYFRIIHKRK